MTETLACLSRELEKDGITLKIDVPADLTVAMNAGQLQQVLMNLIVNARSALLTTRGGAEAVDDSGAGDEEGADCGDHGGG